ncbi:hypothetical protein HK104_007842, partial [Borealophlyctis nickersoniae]
RAPVKLPDGSQHGDLFFDARYLPVIKNVPVTPSLTSAILRVQINKGTNLPRKPVYVQAVVDGKPTAIVTGASGGEETFTWNEAGAAYVPNLHTTHLTLLVKSQTDDHPHPNDKVVAQWSPPAGTGVVAFVDQPDVWVTFDPVDGEDVGLVVGVTFGVVGVGEVVSGGVGGAVPAVAGVPPSVVGATSATTPDSGTLHLTLLSATSLPPDSKNRLPDPYIRTLLDSHTVHETDHQKDTMNPIFNSSTSFPIVSRSKQTLQLQVRDHNSLRRDKVLGTVTVDLNGLREGVEE